MSRSIRIIEPARTVKFAAEVMLKYDVGSLMVVDSFELVGIITEHDIVKAFAQGRKPDTEVRNVMTRKVIFIDPDATLEDAAKLMVKHKIKRLPVCRDNKCVGIVSAMDLMKYEDKLTESLAQLYLMPKKKAGGAG